MTETLEAPAAVVEHPVRKCGTCGQTDDHPKHQIAMAPYQSPFDGSFQFHPHDHENEGCLWYHFDCDAHDGQTDWHAAGIAAQAEHGVTSLADHIALAKSGVHGDDLRAAILNGAV